MEMNPVVEKILSDLPDAFVAFEGSEYAMPVAQAMLGEMPDLAQLREWLAEASEGEVKDLCEPMAVAAEVIESAAGDRDLYFIDDDRVRSYVFRGAKWRAGWVLVVGDGISDDLVNKLKAAEYMVFSSGHREQRDWALPPRETGAIYFLQVMVRYAMVWGQIPPGQDHEMGHFLEQDMPGAMIVRGKVGQVERLVLLALMKMGCPAVVGPEYPYEVGPRAVARTDDEALAAIGEFPNMRVRIFEGERLSLPGGADPAYLREEFTPAHTLSGLLQLRPGDGPAGVVVSGDASSDRIAIIVQVSDEKLDLPVSAHLEAQAVRYGSYLKGVKTYRADDGAFRVEMAEGVTLNGPLLGEVISAGLRLRYPRLGPVKIGVHFGGAAVERERAQAEAFDQQRDAAILAESEETVDEFHLCIDCQPFSHTHVCVITPDRPPMCGRNRNEIKAAALWGTDYRPWARRQIGGKRLQYLATKGEAVDAEGGEWAGVNAMVRELSDGTVQRVRIHAVGEVPHTSCGCFGALAFVIPELGGIGVMHRGYKGLAPGELTWSILANRAGGKQAPGVTGITLNYLKSPRAFGGEGGLSAVKWATEKALAIMRPRLPDGARVATENEANTLTELRGFMS